KNISKFNRESILQFIENNYHTDQMVISSVGEMKFEKLIKLVERYFGSTETKLRINSRKPFENYIPGNRIETKDTFQTHCVLGNIAYDVMHPKRIMMVLLNNIIGGPAMNS